MAVSFLRITQAMTCYMDGYAFEKSAKGQRGKGAKGLCFTISNKSVFTNEFRCNETGDQMHPGEMI